MLLYHLPGLTNRELQDLFVDYASQFVDGMERQLPHNSMQEIRVHLKAINEEINKRRIEGRWETTN